MQVFLFGVGINVNLMVSNKKHPILLSKYQEAFMHFFKCKADDFEMKRLEADDLVIIKYQGQVYQLLHAYDLDQYAALLLTQEKLATAIPLDAWIHIAENVHLEPDFYRNLLLELSEKEKNRLNLALSISSKADNKIKTFWHTLYQFENGTLYAKAIVAASQFYDFKSLKEELIDLLIAEGNNLLNQIHDGIFEIVDIHEMSRREEDTFYLFNVKPVIWKAIS